MKNLVSSRRNNSPSFRHSVLLCCLIPALAHADLNFQRVILDNSYFAFERDVGDIDGDGGNDVVAIQEGDTNLQVFRAASWGLCISCHRHHNFWRMFRAQFSPCHGKTLLRMNKCCMTSHHLQFWTRVGAMRAAIWSVLTTVASLAGEGGRSSLEPLPAGRTAARSRS